MKSLSSRAPKTFLPLREDRISPLRRIGRSGELEENETDAMKL